MLLSLAGAVPGELVDEDRACHNELTERVRAPAGRERARDDARPLDELVLGHFFEQVGAALGERLPVVGDPGTGGAGGGHEGDGAVHEEDAGAHIAVPRLQGGAVEARRRLGDGDVTAGDSCGEARR